MNPRKYIDKSNFEALENEIHIWFFKNDNSPKLIT